MKSILPVIGAFVVFAVSSHQLPETAFDPNSRWGLANEGGAVTGAARDGDAIILRGTGSGLAGAGGRAALTNQYIAADSHNQYWERASA